MDYRPLGKTRLSVSAISFGAGPVPALLTKGEAARQRAAVECAIAAGINWFDTAATYGDGESELCLGHVLTELDAWPRVHVATKVRIPAERLDDPKGYTLESVAASLKRLGASRLAMVQIHNGITRRRGDEPTSITPDDVLGPRGMLAALEELKASGIVECFGLTGLGHLESLCAVLDSGAFSSAQVAYNLLNRTAADPQAARPDEPNYGGLLGECARRGVSALAIRVFAGGALAGKPPSDHTKTTKFFPLAGYERDRQRAAHLADRLPAGSGLKETAIRYVLSNPCVTSALIGFASAEEVAAAVQYAAAGPIRLDGDLLT